MSSKARSAQKLETSQKKLTQQARCSWKHQGSFMRCLVMRARAGRRSCWRYCSLKKEVNLRLLLRSKQRIVACEHEPRSLLWFLIDDDLMREPGNQHLLRVSFDLLRIQRQEPTGFDQFLQSPVHPLLVTV